MILLPSIIILCYSLVFAQIFHCKFRHALPIFIAILLLALHIAAINNVLYYSTYCIYILGIVLFFYYFTVYKNQFLLSIYNHWKELSFLFCIILAFALYTLDADFHSWDEFTFWGIISKELLVNHIFENQLLPTAILDAHAHYPRGPALYHYFMLLLPGYSEGGALLAHFLLHIIFIAPLMGNKNWYHTFFIVAVLFAIVMLYTTGLRAIYNDSTTGLMFASCFAIYFFESNKSKALILILPILICLPIFREIGLVLALIAALVFIVISYKSVNYIQTIPVYAAMFVMPFLSQYLWFCHFGETHDFFGRKEHSLVNLLILIDSFNDQTQLIIVNYTKSILKFLVKEGSIAVYILSIIAWVGTKKYRPILLKQWYLIFFTLTIGFVLFAIWRLYLYFFAFSPAEAIKAASLLRYCGTYWLVFAVIACCYIKKSIFESQSTKAEIITLIILAIIASTTVIINITRIKSNLAIEQSVYNTYVKYTKQLIVQGIEVRFDFNNKKDAMDCYKLNYKLAPNFKKEELTRCLNTEQNFIKDAANITDVILPDVSNSNINITYFPFLHRIE